MKLIPNPFHETAEAKQVKLEEELRLLLISQKHDDLASWALAAWKWVHCNPADTALPSLDEGGHRAEVLRILFDARDVDCSDGLCEGTSGGGS